MEKEKNTLDWVIENTPAFVLGYLVAGLLLGFGMK